MWSLCPKGMYILILPQTFLILTSALHLLQISSRSVGYRTKKHHCKGCQKRLKTPSCKFYKYVTYLKKLMLLRMVLVASITAWTFCCVKTWTLSPLGSHRSGLQWWWDRGWSRRQSYRYQIWWYTMLDPQASLAEHRIRRYRRWHRLFPPEDHSEHPKKCTWPSSSPSSAICRRTLQPYQATCWLVSWLLFNWMADDSFTTPKVSAEHPIWASPCLSHFNHSKPLISNNL